MLPRARISDQISHGGAIIEGSSDVFADGLAVARIGDSVMCTIHGLQTIISGSPNVYADGIPSARVTDDISCGAKIVTGSMTVFIN